MKSITLSWTKTEKSLDKINADLNRVLSKSEFKIATHNQSSVKGRMIVSLFVEDKPGKVRAKCFKDQSYKNLDTKINEFIADKKVKYISQSFIGSNIYTIIYYEASAKELENETIIEDNDNLTVDVNIDDSSDTSQE